VESQPSETAPEYVSRDEVLRLLEQVRAEALEMGRRGAQSFVDRARLRERLENAERVLQRMIKDGVIDEEQARIYRQQEQLDALTSMLPGEPETEAQPARPPRQDVSPIIQKAYQLLAKKGLTPDDPEYVDPLNYSDPIDWVEAVDKAVLAKRARLAREQAKKQAAAQTQAAPAQQGGKPTGATAIEIGGGGNTAASLEQLRKQLRIAYRDGDYELRDRIQAEIDRIIAAMG